jgi:hypothetical protein
VLWCTREACRIAFPRTFGYREIFDALGVFAVVCQYATIAFFVLPRA